MNRIIHILQFGLKLNIVKSLYYSIRFGGRVFIGKGNIHIEGNGKIDFRTKASSLFIGVYHTIPTATTITLMQNARLVVGANAKIHRGTKIVVHEGGTLEIGNNTYINELARVHCRKNITIGNDCAIAWSTNILDTDLHTIYDEAGQVPHHRLLSPMAKESSEPLKATFFGCFSLISQILLFPFLFVSTYMSQNMRKSKNKKVSFLKIL